MSPPNEPDVWGQMLARMTQLLPAGAADTWLRPLRCTGWHRDALCLVVPNAAFRESFIEHYGALVRQVVTDVIGRSVELKFSVRDSREPETERSTQERGALLPVVRASELQAATDQKRWLIERLWTDQAVGVIGGSPKSGKTTLALDLTVSVASGTPCLGMFPALLSGPVLLYAAEDSAPSLRGRLEALTRLRHLDFRNLDVRVITAPALRLDRGDDQQRLDDTVSAHQPALLVLDPLIRIHAIDENAAGQVAPLLGYLRALQRRTGAAVALVHHVRKNAPPTAGAGYSLRGSSDLYAWLDSFLYLRKHQNQLILSAEHRSAPPLEPVPLELVESDAGGTHLRVVSPEAIPTTSTRNSLDGRILDLLAGSPGPLTADQLRSHLQIRNQRVVASLRQLVSQRRIRRVPGGYAVGPCNPPDSHLPL